MGNGNRLASVSYGGGDATGGNATCTYSYTNFNELDVQDYSQNGFVGFGALNVISAGADALGTFPTGTFFKV